VSCVPYPRMRNDDRRRTQALGVTQKFPDANHFLMVHIEFFLFGSERSIYFEELTAGSAIRMEGHDGQIKKAATCISTNC
jgi:hypothetical protein